MLVLGARSIALLDQWVSALQDVLGVERSGLLLRAAACTLAGLLLPSGCNGDWQVPCFPALAKSSLVRDWRRDRHRLGAARLREALPNSPTAALGLSATPTREHDRGFEEAVEPILGPIFFEYGYEDALRDKVISPFGLRNYQVDLTNEEQSAYDRLSRSIARFSRRSSSRRSLVFSRYCDDVLALRDAVRRSPAAVAIGFAARHVNVPSCSMNRSTGLARSMLDFAVLALDPPSTIRPFRQ